MFTFTLRATDNANAANVADHTFTFRAAPMQVVSPATEAYIPVDLPPGRVNVPYSFALKVAGGTAPYTFVESPFAPLIPGLTLSSDGILSGTPQTTGLFSVVPIISDAAGNVLTAPGILLSILPAGTARPLAPVSIELGNASVGVPYALALDTLIRGGTAPF